MTAEQFVTFVGPDGNSWSGRIMVEMPELDRETDTWACPVFADGVVRKTSIFGASALQALTLGLEFLASQLRVFLARGGRIRDPHDGSDQQIDIVFGPIWPR